MGLKILSLLVLCFILYCLIASVGSLIFGYEMPRVLATIVCLLSLLTLFVCVIRNKLAMIEHKLEKML